MKEEEDKQQQNNSSPASFVLFDTNIASTSKIINTKIDVGPNVSSNFVENKNSFDNENEKNLKECGHKPIQNGVLNEIVQFAEENEKILAEENKDFEGWSLWDFESCLSYFSVVYNLGLSTIIQTEESMTLVRKSRPIINNINSKKRCKLDVLNKNQQLKILQNKEISSIKYTNEELIREYVSIGKHSFVCPRSQQALAKKYPEIVIDEFSLLLFHSMDDFLLLKKHEDCLKQMEEDKKRKRRYEEAVRAGKIKKMGRKRKAENDSKREKKDNSEQRQLARLERKERRKREKEENRQRKNANKLIISTTPTNENLPNNLSSISTNAASTPMLFSNNNICCMDDDNDVEENNGKGDSDLERDFSRREQQRIEREAKKIEKERCREEKKRLKIEKKAALAAEKIAARQQKKPS
uniref:Uncharacterized protein n=1 Tax=Meloidogyne javanica TaxID=6303 RepID=A0A915MXH0_MELJA